MNLDEQFVGAIFEELFSDISQSYRDSLAKPDDGAADSFGRARGVLAGLDESQKEAIFQFMEGAMADAVSVVLGTLDGSHFPDHIDGDFVVTYKGEEIQGDMQGIFIGKGEMKGLYK